MSILIKGAELPKICGFGCPCYCAEYSSCQALEDEFGDFVDVQFAKERLPECPLSEVVFCKDCANCVRGDNWEMWCTGRGFPNVLVRDEDYCSHGKRKMTEV